MNANLTRSTMKFLGFSFFISGCIFLIILAVLSYQNTLKYYVTLSDVMAIFAIGTLDLISFTLSISYFIKYGICKGIDYSIQEHLKNSSY